MSSSFDKADRIPREAPLDDRIRTALSSYWGFTELRPLQMEAVRAALAGRDALVVLPTGGGKSLCYQLPPLLRQPGEASLCVVVSPLIALMKDQVDGLRLAGYPAGALNSGSSREDGAAVRREVEAGNIKLLFVAPERLLGDGFIAWLVRLGERDRTRGVASIAIDEAHCISQWGHDFRPEYRRLAELREALPGVPMQAFTATATPRVREDIVQQLRMHKPEVLVGTFDRPNLTYRIIPRIGNGETQIEEVLRRHGAGSDGSEAAIVYCMSRAQTERVAAGLCARGLKAEAYHAGMSPESRHRVQDAFASERLNIVVATVAFGMGIDRGDVRCVIHASMPKTVEAYQQETGRAGRDGLPSECVLLHQGGDVQKWISLIERSAGQAEVHVPREVIEAQIELINEMGRMASGVRCRHRALSEYFGQEYAPPQQPANAERAGSPNGCGACDVCLGEMESEEDSTTVARKILSCVARLRGTGLHEQAFGAAYIADVLRGAGLGKIVERKHHLLSTFGLLKGVARENIIGHIGQLVDAGVLARAPGEYPTIHLTRSSGTVLRGERDVKLLRAKSAELVAAGDRARKRVDYSGVAAAPLSAEERSLFEVLRRLRREIADGLGVPPFVVFGDAALEEMCRVRPGSLATFAHIKGVGRSKLEQFGERFVGAIGEHCAANGLALDALAGSRPRPILAESARDAASSMNDAKRRAFDLFGRGMGVDEVAGQIGRARSTTSDYLLEFVELKRPRDVGPWVSAADYRRVIEASEKLNAERLKPIYEELGGTVGYEQIRIVFLHRAAQASSGIGDRV
ncbi:MAG TPA: RecQ family ATP-dependent DNA helicase [Phycisphaerales bacterium]|nr:RecQ family ATP-dependent DNA helicase [Phycisphaerales bacterium]